MPRPRLHRAALVLLATLPTLAVACKEDPVDDTGGGGTDTGDGVDSPCGPWSAVWQGGAQWDWVLDPAWATEQEKEGGWRSEALGSEEYNGRIVWRTQDTAEYTGSVYKEEGSQVEWRFACDEQGVWLHQFEGVWSRTNNLGEEEGWWSVEFEEPPLWQPFDLAVGDTWEIDTSYDYSTQGTSSARMGLTASFEVVGEQSVTVGAGTFDALEIAVDWSGDPRTDFDADSFHKMVARDVGEVQIVGRANLEDFELDPTFQTQ